MPNRAMAVQALPQSSTLRSYLSLFVIIAIPISICVRYLFLRAPLSAKSPPVVSDNYPIIGAFAFFTRRWDFFRHAISQSPTGNFSFHLGKWPLIGLSGEEGRKVFFESKQLGFAEGYDLPNASVTLAKSTNPVKLRGHVWSRS